jgi:hypothetical protein
VARVTSAKHGPQELEALLGSLRSLRHLNGYEEAKRLLEEIRTTRAKHAAIRAIRSRLR